MKRLVGSIAIALLFSAGASANNWSSDPRPSDGETQFYVNLSGEVPQRCRMFTTQDRSIELDVNDAQADDSEFKFQAWCNTGSSKGTLVIGAQAFEHQNGTDVIPLSVSFNGTTGTIDSTNNASNSHAIVTDIQVSNDSQGNMGAYNILKIKPEVNGFETAGEYSTAMYVALYPK